MIKPKVFLILAAVLLVMIGAWYGIPKSRPNTTTNSQSQRIGNVLFKDFDPTQVVKINFGRDGKSVSLTMDESTGWKVASHGKRPADNEKVFTLLHFLDSAKIGGVRNEKADAAKFELDAKQRTLLKLYDRDEKELLSLFVGGTAGKDKSFVMLKEGDEFLETTKGIDSHLGIKYRNSVPYLTADHWYNLRIIPGKRKDILGFSVEHPNLKIEPNAYKLWLVHPTKGPIEPDKDIADDDDDERPLDDPFATKKTKLSWQVLSHGKKTADEQVCDTICASVLPLNVKGYEDKIPEKELQFDKPRAIFTFWLTDGSKHTLTFGKRVDSQFFFKLNDGSDIYRTGPELYHDLFKPMKEIIEGKPKQPAQR